MADGCQGAEQRSRIRAVETPGNGENTLKPNTVKVYTSTGAMYRTAQVAGTATSATVSSHLQSPYYLTVVPTNSIGGSTESAMSYTLTVR